MSLYFRAGISFIGIGLSVMMTSCKPTAAGVQPKMHCIKMSANISQDVYRCNTGGIICILVDGYTSGISCF